jgi:hypothetical protein
MFIGVYYYSAGRSNWQILEVKREREREGNEDLSVPNKEYIYIKEKEIRSTNLLCIPA